MFGGGTHENVNGSELTPHIDFNFDTRGKLHRRLNLLLYLNKEWDERWGGSIELHSDPRSPQSNEVKSFLPLFNRCVIFETNEHSWHGFPQVHLPEDKRHLSRKSFSIYLYTRERPAEDTAPPHTTVYVPRPLPSHIQPGTTLSAADFDVIQGLIDRRDGLIRFYQEKELAISREEQKRQEYLHHLEAFIRLPLTGYGVQQGAVHGFWPDGWVGKHLEFQVQLDRKISRMLVLGAVPGFGPLKSNLSIQLNETFHSFSIRRDEELRVEAQVQAEMGNVLKVSVTASESMSPVRAGVGEDVRELVFFLYQVRFD
jgi:hypothetical protein